VFLSGASTLIYQIVWQRVLVRIMGAALPAVTSILMLFMAGLAWGALVAGRKADKSTAPLKIYSWLELALASIGLLFPLATNQRAIDYLLHLVATCTQYCCHADPVAAYATPAGWTFVNLMLTSVVSLLILVPTALMGATLPFAVKSLAITRLFSQAETAEAAGNPQGEPSAPPIPAETRGLGKAVAGLYSINLLGATCGSLAAAFLILPIAGVNNTIRAAAILNLLCSLGLQLLHRSQAELAGAWPEQGAAADGDVAIRRDRSPFFTWQLCVIAGFSSLSALALEVGLTRLFCLVLGSSTYALGAVAAFCLAGFAGGAWLARVLLARRGNFAWQLASIFAMTGILIAASLYMIAELPWLLTRMELSISGSNYAAYILSRCLLVFLMVTPITAALGVVFPLMLGHVSSRFSNAAGMTGKLFCASTVGSIAGAALAGYVLIPQLIHLSRIATIFDQTSGIQNTIVFVALVQIVLAAVSFVSAASTCQRSQTIVFSLTCCVFGFLICGRPNWQPAAMSSGLSFLPRANIEALDRTKFERAFSSGSSSQLIFYKEGQSATVTVGSTEAANIIYLKNDGKMEAALPLNPDKPSATSDAPTHILLGSAAALFSVSEPAKAFVIGFGSGTTSGALLSGRSVSQCTIAEIEPAVYDASTYFNRVNRQPLRGQWLKDGRVLPVVADARNLLSLSSGGYEAIVSQPAEPWVNGAGDLYSLEFWQLAKRKLSEHGVFCQWLQLYAIDPGHLAVLLRTFMHEFPNTVCLHPQGGGEIILLGFADQKDRLDLARADDRLSRSAAAKTLLSEIGITDADQLNATVIGTSDKLAQFCSREEAKSGIRAFNTDNNLMLEYAGPPQLFDAENIATENITALLQN
jgi:spermidine synthase